MTDDPTLSYLRDQFGAEPQTEPEATVEQPRDDQGRFAAPEPEAVEPQETEPAAEAAPEQELILGKYRSVDDLAEAYKNLEREKGRLAQEVGTLRQQTTPEPEPQPQYDFTGAEEYAADPQLAAQYAAAAAQTGDDLAYERIIRAWGESDPFGAARFDARVEVWRQQRQYAAQVAPQLQTAQQIAAQQEQQQALADVTSLHPDFAEVVQGIDFDRIAEQAATRPSLRSALSAYAQSANRETAAALFDTLYSVQKAERDATIAQAAQTAQAQHQAETRDAKTQAAVATATSAPAAETTSADPELEKFYEFMRTPSPTNWLAGR